MTSKQMTLLPTELTAKFRHLCKSRTVHGALQAKCSFLHNDKEYPGILFPSDNEEWFADIPEDALIKVHRISPCNDERYPDEYKGTALPLEQQSLETPVKAEAAVVDMSKMPFLLREAATMIEMLLAIADKEQTAPLPQPTKSDAPYRSPNQWTDEIIEIICSNENFKTKPFSAIGLNAYMESCFDDFWEGDLVMLENRSRWRSRVSVALSKLLTRNFIERVPGTQKHYQITQQTINQINNHD